MRPPATTSRTWRILGNPKGRVAVELDGAVPMPSLALTATVAQHVQAHVVDWEAVGWNDRLA